MTAETIIDAFRGNNENTRFASETLSRMCPQQGAAGQASTRPSSVEEDNQNVQSGGTPAPTVFAAVYSELCGVKAISFDFS